LGDGTTLKNLFDGGTLSGKRITTLFFRHSGFRKGKNRDERFDSSTIGKNMPTLNTSLLEGIQKYRLLINIKMLKWEV
jgi:hypothetical protein